MLHSPRFQGTEISRIAERAGFNKATISPVEDAACMALHLF